MITKRNMDRESRWLETILYARRILLLECYRKYVSHVIKSCILKILNLKENVDCKNFVQVAEKQIQAPKLMLKSWQSDSFRFYCKGILNKRRLKYTEIGTFLLTVLASGSRLSKNKQI